LRICPAAPFQFWIARLRDLSFGLPDCAISVLDSLNRAISVLESLNRAISVLDSTNRAISVMDSLNRAISVLESPSRAISVMGLTDRDIRDIIYSVYWRDLIEKKVS